MLTGRKSQAIRLLLSGTKLSGYVDTEFTGGRSYGNFSSYIHLEKTQQLK